MPHILFSAKCGVGVGSGARWGMDKDAISMGARYEVTKKYASGYAGASKKDKARILDAEVAVTGWNRDHARQQLRARLRQPPGRATGTVVVLDRRKTKARKYSHDAVKVLQYVWSVSGGSCGKYLVACMADLIESLESHGHLVDGHTITIPRSRTSC